MGANKYRRICGPAQLCSRSPPIYFIPSDQQWLPPACWHLQEGEGFGVNAEVNGENDYSAESLLALDGECKNGWKRKQELFPDDFKK